ncbi:CoA ester lyase [Limnohabitans sp. 2KL-51]|uniref:HpcH/HpaI aldolase/citrate lyase family protein n=1 Tax=Limnohabitans sp. 2KL-51 TaxID=1977911 RepID=UPI000D3BB4AC|nr:CoA ester lyase [Limnohabitans sp. 2KL-51]PUE44400.1 CoA ester lyase [Limnohabitans sp. 2KL-51]
MKLRSLLFVPGDSERKLQKAIDSNADVLILDLEDSVAASRKPIARGMVSDYIRSQAKNHNAALYVRINPLDSSSAMVDLATACVPGLAGILLPKTQGFEDIIRLGYCLDALEARVGIEHGTVKILPVATETPQAVLRMNGFVPSPRLSGVTWGAEDLSAAIGAFSNRDEEGGDWSPLYIWAGALCLAAAAAAKTQAIDTLHANFRDDAGLRTACRISRRRGFRGRIAIHPDQVDMINEAYSPSEAELAHARRIVEAFAANPDVGTLSIDGCMVDMPHLAQARHTLGHN